MLNLSIPEDSAASVLLQRALLYFMSGTPGKYISGEQGHKVPNQSSFIFCGAIQQFGFYAHLLGRYAVVVLVSLLAASCAGYRGGWVSVAYLGDTPPSVLANSRGSIKGDNPPELSLPGLTLHVTINNQLCTYDTVVYFFALPVSVDLSNVHSRIIEPGKTRVYVTATPLVPGFVFRQAAAVLQVAEKRFTGAAGFEFGMWDDAWKRVERGGKYEHRPIASEYILSEVGRTYLLSIDFLTPVPSPESPDIVLDLSQALRSTTQSPLPLIRFAPARWNESYG